MSQANQIVSRRGIGGLLMRGAIARLQMAVAASLVLWACVMWASLSHPTPPKSEEPQAPSPPALRRIVGTGQQTPIGGIFDRFDVEFSRSLPRSMRGARWLSTPPSCATRLPKGFSLPAAVTSRKLPPSVTACRAVEF